MSLPIDSKIESLQVATKFHFGLLLNFIFVSDRFVTLDSLKSEASERSEVLLLGTSSSSAPTENTEQRTGMVRRTSSSCEYGDLPWRQTVAAVAQKLKPVPSAVVVIGCGPD